MVTAKLASSKFDFTNTCRMECLAAIKGGKEQSVMEHILASKKDIKNTAIIYTAA